MTTIECGYYELPESEVFHYAGYECAAWSKDTLVPAGRYPVTAQVEDGHVKSFSVKLTGTISQDYFQSLYCGMPIGKAYDRTQNAGQPSDHFLSMYSYDAPRDKSGRWHIDYSVLPNVGRCIHCGTVTFGYATYGTTLCSTCLRYTSQGDEIMAATRFPRLMKVLGCDWHGTVAAYMLAEAVYDRNEYNRKQVAAILRRVRAARKQFGYPEGTGWFKVSEDGRVDSNGRFLGRIEVAA